MADSCAGHQPASPGETAEASSRVETFPRRLDLDTGLADQHDGPDYVDDWMEKNLSPNIIDFVRNCCTSFVRWDLLQQLHAEPEGMTAERLSSAIGANQTTTSSELDSLGALGLVRRSRRGGRTTYRVELDSTLGQALDATVRAFNENREFRFALVYAIVRASHRGRVLD